MPHLPLKPSFPLSLDAEIEDTKDGVGAEVDDAEVLLGTK